MIALVVPRSGGIFDTIAGLPLHPLVVHAVVVLLPLSALLVIGVCLLPPLRRRYSGFALFCALVSTALTFVAKEAGEQLERRVGTPANDHAEWGDRLFVVSAIFLLLTFVWWLLQRRARAAGRSLGVAWFFGGLASLAALATLVVTVLAGHTGAEASWGDVVAADSGAATSSATGTASTSATSGAAGAAASNGSSTGSSTTSGYTMAQVKSHSTQSSCWAAINGNVYNLTSWISQHPGGSAQIIALCGTDGSSAFNAQHGGQSRPGNELKAFLLGPLKG